MKKVNIGVITRYFPFCPSVSYYVLLLWHLCYPASFRAWVAFPLNQARNELSFGSESLMTFKQNPRLWTALICQLKVMLSVYVYGGYSSDGLQCGFRNKAVLPRHCVDPTQDFPLLYFFGFFFLLDWLWELLPKWILPTGCSFSQTASVWSFPGGAFLQEQTTPTWVFHGVTSLASKPAPIWVPHIHRSCQEPMS